MSNPFRLAVVGVGRIGQLHALHASELAQESGGTVVFSAVVDPIEERARETAARFSAKQSTTVQPFFSAEALAAANASDGAMICSPTDCHQSNTAVLVKAGQRVILEKPLTGDLVADRAFAKELNQNHPNAVMLA